MPNLIISSDGGLAVVTGLEGAQMQTGEEIAPQTDAAVSAYLEIMQALGEQQMTDDLQFINLQELTDVRIGCGGRFDLRIGAVDSDLSYRIRFAQTVMSERLSPSDIGRLYWAFSVKSIRSSPRAVTSNCLFSMSIKTSLFHMFFDIFNLS